MAVIKELDDKRIDYYRNLNFTPDSHLRDRVFICEGILAVQKGLESGLELHSALVDEKSRVKLEQYLKGVRDEKVLIAEKELIDRAAGFKLHEAALAIMRMPEDTALVEMPERIVALNGIINSENVGAIARNAVAFGFRGMIYDSGTSSIFMRRAVRVSMGSACLLKSRRTEDLAGELAKLKGLGYMIIACETGEGAKEVNELEACGKAVVILGTEKHGIAAEILAAADETAKIGMEPELASINVGAASAVIMHKMYSMKKRMK